MCWYAAFGIGAVIVPSDRLGPVCSRGGGTSGGSGSMGHPGLRTLLNSPESRRCFISLKDNVGLTLEGSARRIIRNLFITLASLVSPTDVKVV